eukprot:323454_1
MMSATILMILSCLMKQSNGHIQENLSLHHWSEIPISFSQSYRSCGFYNDSIFTFSARKAYQFNLTNDNNSWISYSFPSMSVSPSFLGQSYVQYNQYIYFLYTNQFGVFNMENKTVIYPLSNKYTIVYGRRSCIAISNNGRNRKTKPHHAIQCYNDCKMSSTFIL